MGPLASINGRITTLVFTISSKSLPSFADNYYPLAFFFLACFWALVGNINMKYQLELSCNLLLNINVT